MQNYNGLLTKDGKPIYSYEHIEKLRAIEDEKRKTKTPSRTFISQSGAQEYVQYSDADIDGTGGNRGGGKANSYNTPVATPSGFRKMGELEVGDFICTPYDGIQKVSQIFEQGEHTVYVLHFDDGSTVTCMDNHRFYGRSHPDEPFMVWEARDIFDIYRIDASFPNSLRKNRYDYFEIPICGEVEMNEEVQNVDLPIDPFLLGVMSATGFWETERGRLNIGNNPWVKAKCWVAGYKPKKNKKTGYYYITCIPEAAKRFLPHSSKKVLAHIPEAYMSASIPCRWAFLRGVMYVSGKSAKKHPYLQLPNKKFIEQFAQMVRSLGAWTKVSQVTDDVEKMGWWRVNISLPDEKKIWDCGNRKDRAHTWFDTPTKMPTKPTTPTLTKKLLYIVKPKDKRKCRCITITGSDHLYMTDAWTINHNTAMLLTKPLQDISNRYFNGIIFRKNKDDFENIINETMKWYEPLGKYNRSKDDMTWYFHAGSKLGLTYFDMPYQDFDDKYRGQQFAYIGLDEAPQMSFQMFKFLTTVNRNTNNIKSRMLFTCNPDPLSWLRKFLDWYIGKESTVYADGKLHPERKGFIIPERSGKIRYFYSPDDSVDNIIWGNSPHEVYLQIRDIADDGWNEQLARFGHTRETYLVKSFRFTKAELLDNKALMALDEDYIKNLYQQPPEVRARELEGNWDIIRTSNDLIQPFHFDQCFHNMQMLGDRVRRASCDVAGDGGDNCVTFFKIGNHVQDAYVCQRDPYNTVPLIKAKLREWGVLEQNFVYDLQGMGQVFKGAFPNAVKFNNQEAPEGDDKKLYDCIKSQSAYQFAQHSQQGEWSIEPTLLDREYKIGKVTMKLYNILQSERKAIRQDMSKQDRGWCLIHKEQMKHRSVVGHSPDFIEALMMFEIFDIKGDDTEVPIFLTNHVKTVRTFGFDDDNSNNNNIHRHGRPMRTIRRF